MEMSSVCICMIVVALHSISKNLNSNTIKLAQSIVKRVYMLQFWIIVCWFLNGRAFLFAAG